MNNNMLIFSGKSTVHAKEWQLQWLHIDLTILFAWYVLLQEVELAPRLEKRKPLQNLLNQVCLLLSKSLNSQVVIKRLLTWCSEVSTSSLILITPAICHVSSVSMKVCYVMIEQRFDCLHLLPVPFWCQSDCACCILANEINGGSER